MSDLHIDHVSTRLLDVPLFRPHGFATFTATSQPILLVEVGLACLLYTSDAADE